MWKTNDKGFTLIELVISMVIFGIILTPAYSLLTSGILSWKHGTEQIDVVQNMRFSMERMTSEIKQAVSTPAPLVTAAKIEFYVPKGDFSGTTYVAYQFDGNEELERKEGTGTFQPVASKIKSVLYYSYSLNPDALFLFLTILIL